MGLMTALFLACFLGWTWWAYLQPQPRTHGGGRAAAPLHGGRRDEQGHRRDQVLGHADEADGIEEYDNPLPTGGWASSGSPSLFAIGYTLHYHFIAHRSQVKELAAEMAEAQRALAAVGRPGEAGGHPRAGGEGRGGLPDQLRGLPRRRPARAGSARTSPTTSGSTAASPRRSSTITRACRRRGCPPGVPSWGRRRSARSPPTSSRQHGRSEADDAGLRGDPQWVYTQHIDGQLPAAAAAGPSWRCTSSSSSPPGSWSAATRRCASTCRSARLYAFGAIFTASDTCCSCCSLLFLAFSLFFFTSLFGPPLVRLRLPADGAARHLDPPAGALHRGRAHHPPPPRRRPLERGTAPGGRRPSGRSSPSRRCWSPWAS